MISMLEMICSHEGNLQCSIGQHSVYQKVGREERVCTQTPYKKYQKIIIIMTYDLKTLTGSKQKEDMSHFLERLAFGILEFTDEAFA